MSTIDRQYLNLLKDTVENGSFKETRSGAVYSIFGRSLRFSFKEGFPILTTKKVFVRGIIHELLWFLHGETNIKYLVENNVHIWDDDAYRHYLSLMKDRNVHSVVDKDTFLKLVLNGDKIVNADESFEYTFGDLGPVYGKQWRKYGQKQIDQIQNIIEMLKNNPDDRRMICMAWNPTDFEDMALPPCHYGFQVYTRKLTNQERLEWLWENSNGEYDEWKIPSEEKLNELNVPQRELSLMWMQRSVDEILGLPFNCTSYSILAAMIAQCANMTVGDVTCSLGDCHVYENHLNAVNEQLTRDPDKYNLPKLELNKNIKNINDFTFNDIKVIGYESYPSIKAPLSVG